MRNHIPNRNFHPFIAVFRQIGDSKYCVSMFGKKPLCLSRSWAQMATVTGLSDGKTAYSHIIFANERRFVAKIVQVLP